MGEEEGGVREAEGASTCGRVGTRANRLLFSNSKSVKSSRSKSTTDEGETDADGRTERAPLARFNGIRTGCLLGSLASLVARLVGGLVGWLVG